MKTESLNEVLPKYRLTKNDQPIIVSNDYNDVKCDYNIMIGSSEEGDVIKMIENGKVIEVTTIGNET